MFKNKRQLQSKKTESKYKNQNFISESENLKSKLRI